MNVTSVNREVEISGDSRDVCLLSVSQHRGNICPESCPDVTHSALQILTTFVQLKTIAFYC